MGGNCCSFKPKKPMRPIPRSINTNLEPDPVVLYSDSCYFKPRQQLYYNKLLIQKTPCVNIKPPEDWETSEIIGQGSFGRVLFGQDKQTKVLLAIKEIPLIDLNNISAVAEEVEILSQLSHPNIVSYMGSKTDNERLFIFMEYISGGTIHSLLNKYKRFSESLIRTYTYQILKGLEYLHYHNIVHRDIKGTNILVNSQGTCKLADFGSAKKIIGMERTSSITGTINWMAPEVIKGTGHGRYADIWSIGCIIIEMATSKPPWNEYNQVDVILNVCNTDIVPELPSEFSQDAHNFISLCFKRKPNDRPNVNELLAHPFVSFIDNPEYFVSDSTRYMTDQHNI